MVACSVNLLVDACNQGDIDTVREFLNEGRIDSLTEEGESLLSAACSAGCHFLVEMILDMGADVEGEIAGADQSAVEAGEGRRPPRPRPVDDERAGEAGEGARGQDNPPSTSSVAMARTTSA